MARIWVRKSIAALEAEASEVRREGCRLQRRHSAQAQPLGAQSGRARHRRYHRRRYFCAHRTCRSRQCRAGDHIILRAGRDRLRLRRALLRRAGRGRADCRQRIHLCLCLDGRDRGLDHRLGSAAGIRAGLRHGRDRLVRLRGELPFRLRHHRSARVRPFAASITMPRSTPGTRPALSSTRRRC